MDFEFIGMVTVDYKNKEHGNDELFLYVKFISGIPFLGVSEDENGSIYSVSVNEYGCYMVTIDGITYRLNLSNFVKNLENHQRQNRV